VTPTFAQHSHMPTLLQLHNPSNHLLPSHLTPLQAVNAAGVLYHPTPAPLHNYMITAAPSTVLHKQAPFDYNPNLPTHSTLLSMVSAVLLLLTSSSSTSMMMVYKRVSPMYPSADTNHSPLRPRHGKSPSDAQFMNENCRIKSSNLNNHSQHFQEVSGLNFNIPRNTHEFFHFDDLPANIQTKRHAASVRMHQLGFTPIDNFTFLHPPPTGTTASTNIVSPLHPPSVVNPDCDDSATANSMSILTHNAANDKISSHASHLNLNTQLNSTNKRARSTSSQSYMADPTTQYIFLSTPINEPFSTTHNNL
jgi:hypothetical protein